MSWIQFVIGTSPDHDISRDTSQLFSDMLPTHIHQGGPVTACVAHGGPWPQSLTWLGSAVKGTRGVVAAVLLQIALDLELTVHWSLIPTSTCPPHFIRISLIRYDRIVSNDYIDVWPVCWTGQAHIDSIGDRVDPCDNEMIAFNFPYLHDKHISMCFLKRESWFGEHLRAWWIAKAPLTDQITSVVLHCRIFSTKTDIRTMSNRRCHTNSYRLDIAAISDFMII